MGAASRLLNPVTNPAGYMTAAGTVYAAAVMLYNVYHHHGVIDVPVIVAALAAMGALLTRQVVTPVSDPVDGAGRPLVPAPPLPAPPAAIAVAPAVPPPPPHGL